MFLILSTRSIWSICHQPLFDPSRTRPIYDEPITRSEESYYMYLILCDLETSKMRLFRLLSCVGTGHSSGRSHTQNWTPWPAMNYSKNVWVDKVLLAEIRNLYSSPSWMSNTFPLLPLSYSPYVQTFFQHFVLKHLKNLKTNHLKTYVVVGMPHTLEVQGLILRMENLPILSPICSNITHVSDAP